MTDTAEKARALRLERLQTMLDQHLSHPAAALEVLMAELRIGEHQAERWEALHAAALRDGKEQELAEAYRKVATARRLKQLSADAHAEVLMHAANFSIGALGDQKGAEGFLLGVLETVPNHLEAFTRLERRFEAEGEKLRLLDLYALVAINPPKPAADLARAAVNTIVPLPSKIRVSDESCKRLVSFAPASPGLIDVLESHCMKTGRPQLAASVRQQTLELGGLPTAVVMDQHQRLVDLYLGELNTPEQALPHVEALLGRDPSDAKALRAAERLRLLPNREVASRAAAALQEARHQLRARS